MYKISHLTTIAFHETSTSVSIIKSQELAPKYFLQFLSEFMFAQFEVERINCMRKLANFVSLVKKIVPVDCNLFGVSCMKCVVVVERVFSYIEQVINIQAGT